MQFPVTPGDHRNLAKGIKWWLEAHSSYHGASPGYKYGSSEEFILKETRPMGAMFDEMGAIPDMRFGKCFDNAWEVSQLNHRYRYFEGWAAMDHGIPTHHAWLYDTWTRKIEDPTWRRFYMSKRVEFPQEPWSGCGVYWGIPVHPADHLQWAARTGHPNLLAVYDDDHKDVLLHGAKAFSSRLAIDHQPPVVL